ncbi:MAG: pyocin knob domain-containing protein, partial [Pseudomonadota bacterium]
SLSQDGLSSLGIGTTTDATNRLAVRSPATLLSHDGADHQLKINKANESDTASLLFQSDFTGQAEIGLAGQRDLSVKVSPDGASWTEAMVVDAASGALRGAAVQATTDDANPGKLMTVGAFGLGADCPDLGMRDLDSVTESGFWAQPTGAEATVARNYPVDGFQGTVLVLRGGASGGGAQLATDAITGRTYMRGLSNAGTWSAWRPVVQIGDEVGRTFRNRDTLVAYMAAPARTPDDGEVFNDGRMQYVYETGATVIPDLPGLIPQGTVSPLHWGAKADATDQTAEIAAAWAYWQSLTAAKGNQNPANGQLAFYFPAGQYRSTDGLVLETSTTGGTIYGDGQASVLNKIDLRLDGSIECTISDLRLIGATATGVEIAGNANGNLLSRLVIRDKVDGVLHTASVQTKVADSEIYKCDNNVRIVSCNGDSYTNVNSTSARWYCLIQNGASGELKLSNCRFTGAGTGNSDPNGGWSNIYVYGSSGSAAVECYYGQVTATSAVRGGRQYDIAGIVESPDRPGNIRITTTTPHELVPGFNDLGLNGTVNYDGNDFIVLDVISPTEFDVDLTFVADEAQGKIWLKGWDLLVESTSSTQSVNDLFFIGGNYNFVKLDAGFNINFSFARLKEQVWIGDTYQPSRVTIIRDGRGRSQPTQADIPLGGPGSARGWAEIGTFDETPSWGVNGGEKVALRSPHVAAGVGANNLPTLNEIALFADRATVRINEQEMTVGEDAPASALQLSMPNAGIVQAMNTPKAMGVIRWSGGVPTLVNEFNVASAIHEVTDADGQVTVSFVTPFASDSAPVPTITPLTNGDGADIKVSVVQGGQIKFAGAVNGVAADVDFSFVIYGDLI